MYRRQLLGLCATTAIGAGCLEAMPATDKSESPTNASGSTPAPTAHRNRAWSGLGEVHVRNETSKIHTITLTVAKRHADEPEFDESHDYPARTDRTIQDVITETGVYELSVATETGPTGTYEWDLSDCDNYDYLVIAVRTEQVIFRKQSQTIVPPPTCAQGTPTER